MVSVAKRNPTRESRRDGIPDTVPEIIGDNQDVDVRKSTDMSEKLPTSTPSLPELVRRFLRSRQHLRPKTQEYYREKLEGMLYFANLKQWPQDPTLITRNHIRDFVDYVATEEFRWHGDGRRGTYKKASPGTVYHYAKVMRTFFTWCEDEDYLETSPATKYKPPKANFKDVEPYTDDEVAAMLDTCELDIQRGNRFLGVRNLALISVFIDTGLRLEENAGIKLSDLDPRLQQVRVFGKGAKFRVVPINGRARKALKTYLTEVRQPGMDELWQTEDGAPLSPYSVSTMIERLKRRAGVRSGGGAHRFRHYFATRYLEAGGDINSLRLLLGHRTLSMVLKYTQFVNARCALREHEDVSPLDRLYNGGSQQSNETWGYRQ